MAITKSIDEVTLRQLLLQTADYLRFFVRYWYISAVSGILVAAIFIYRLTDIKPTYNARIVSLFRADISPKNNAATVQTFSKVANSQLAVERTLFDTIKVDGKIDLTINHYLNTYEVAYPNFTKLNLPTGFRFANGDLSSFDALHLRTYRAIMYKITTHRSDFSDGFVDVSMEEKLGFLTLNFSSPSEDLSVQFVERLVKNLQNIYEETILLSKQKGYSLLKEQVERVEVQTKEKLSELLAFKKEKKKGKTAAIQSAELDLEILKSRLFQLQKQFASASRDLGQQYPVTTVTERPILPLVPYLPSKLWFSIKGLVIGVFVSLFFLMMIKIISDTLKE